MDRKYKLLIASSLVSVIATGCSSYGSRGNTDPQTSVTGSGGGYASQQAAQSSVDQNQQTCGTCGVQNTQATNTTTTNGRSQQWYIDQWNRQQQGKQTTVNTSGRTSQWYVDQYNRQQAADKAAAAARAAAAKAAAAATATQSQAVASNGRTRQWYIDQWNRQQSGQTQTQTQAYVPPKPVVVTQPAPYVPPVSVAPKPYVAPAPAPKTSTQYIDYTGGVAATAAAPSNKSLYTGSYQQPSQTYTAYTPKTYTGGVSTSSTSYTATTPASNGNTYVVKKGDTVFEVMRQTGVYWKEIISINNLQAPSYTIQPGQTLRLK